MPDEEEYRRRIASFGPAELTRLWSGIVRGETPGWERGKALEYLVLRAFEVEGAEVTWPYTVEVEGNILEQIDGVVYTEGLVALFECKDYARPVNFEPIARMRQMLARRPPQVIGCCIARSGFTDEATFLAERSSPQNILLWDGEDLAIGVTQGVMRQALRAKFRHAVEHAAPDFDFLLS